MARYDRISDLDVAPVENGIPAWKRALDVSLVLVFSPGLLLLGAVVALLIKCGSRGPVFFTQERVGYKGRRFTCFKFRTMKVNADEELHRSYTRHLIHSQDPMIKLDLQKDSRLIPFAAVLRAGGLDELPQLFNVLRGEMSLVGPRPCIPYEFQQYEPAQRKRFDAAPGLTGLWQVSGKNRTTFAQMIELDLAYARHKSLWLDLKILLKTVPALWGQYSDLRLARREESAPDAGLEQIS